MSSSYTKNVSKLLAVDKIRFYKLFELFQFSIIFLVLAILFSKAIDGIFKSDTESISKKSSLQLHVELVVISFLYCVVSYYVHKFAHIIPSIMSVIDNDFKPHSTLDYSIHIVFIVVFVKMNSSLVKRLKHLKYVK